ncbi:MAG: glycosyltransferase, partial [Deltaproteobacteria bacterium]|nr:glycosyltransferase [Deltaproteobacteria bacterium]
PVVGYFGALAKWFDYDLVRHLARARPEYRLVLIGPDYDGSLKASSVSDLSNVTCLGPIDYRLLPRYAQHFDVSTIPFVLNDITASTSPIKLFEYMALGHPIVTTNMPECRKYRSALIAHSREEFVEQVDRALALRGDESYLKVLRDEASSNTWKSKAEEISRLLVRSYGLRLEGET